MFSASLYLTPHPPTLPRVALRRPTLLHATPKSAFLSVTRGAPCCSVPLLVTPWYSSPFPCTLWHSSAFLVLCVLHSTPLHSSYSVSSTALPGTPFCPWYSRAMHNDLHALRTLSYSPFGNTILFFLRSTRNLKMENH